MTSTDSVEANLAAMLVQLESVSSESDLVCFPENALFMRLGKKPQMPALQIQGDCFQKIQAIVERRNFCVLIGSAPLQDPDFENRTTNAMVLFEPGKKPRAVYRKIHLFDVDVTGAPPVRESDSFAHGRHPATLMVKGWKLGLSICYDLRFAELYSHYARQGVHAILVPSSFLVPTGQAHWHVLLRARAIESQCFVIAAAQAGEHQGTHGEIRHTFGHSLVVDPWGVVLEDLGDQGPDLRLVRLDPRRLEQVQKQIPQATHRRLQEKP